MFEVFNPLLHRHDFFCKTVMPLEELMLANVNINVCLTLITCYIFISYENRGAQKLICHLEKPILKQGEKLFRSLQTILYFASCYIYLTGFFHNITPMKQPYNKSKMMISGKLCKRHQNGRVAPLVKAKLICFS